MADIDDMEMSFNEFCDDGDLVLVLEKVMDGPFEFIHEDDSRQRIVKVEEWNVVGGLRPIFDEDGDVIEEEAISLDDLLSGNF